MTRVMIDAQGRPVETVVTRRGRFEWDWKFSFNCVIPQTRMRDGKLETTSDIQKVGCSSGTSFTHATAKRAARRAWKKLGINSTASPSIYVHNL